MRVFIYIAIILTMIIFSSCDSQKKGSNLLDESKKISFIEKSILKTSTYHTENLHYIQKIGTRLSPHIKNPIFVNLMPTNVTQYKNIYKTDIVSLSAKSQVDNYNKDLENQSFKKENLITKQEILEFIKKSNSTPIILFGHSIYGKTLVLPNGQKYSISMLHKECKTLNKTCLVLTCDGDDFDIEGKITASEALKIFNSAHHAFINQKISRVEDLKEVMIKKRDSLKNKHQIIVSFTVINLSTGATYLVYNFVQEKK